MGVSFATPLAALVALFALVPVAAAALRERRLRLVREALALDRPHRRERRPATLALGAFFGLVAIAAAQPVLTQEKRVFARADAEAFVVVDVSRSMLAGASAGSPTRFERAAELAREFRAGLSEIPTGVVSLTDRPLPHLFPTADRQLFDAVVGRALGVEKPPPGDRREGRATALGSLVALGRDNYFSAESARRLVLVLTDGESLVFDPGPVARQLVRDGVGLVLVRLGTTGERIYRPDGSIEQGYRPDRTGDPLLAAIARSLPGGRVLEERDATEALALARAYLGEGPVAGVVTERREVPLGGYVALAAALPLAFLLAGALPAGRLRLGAR